jgi:hypothetical protein
MWRTSQGERVLKGAEWNLFREGLAGLRDTVEDDFAGDGESHSGHAAFDVLQPAQKLAMLALVGQALHDEAVRSPAHTAHNEATIAAVFDQISLGIVEEVTNQGSLPIDGAQFWRGLVREAWVGIADPSMHSRLSPSCADIETWSTIVDLLSEQILWDYDFAMGDRFLDSDPEESRAMMQELGIQPDYFTEIAPDPGDSELETAREILRKLTGRGQPAERDLFRGL